VTAQLARRVALEAERRAAHLSPGG
jgi:hypothetical protein